MISGWEDCGDLRAPLADKREVAAVDDKRVRDAGGVEARVRELVDILLPFSGDGLRERALFVTGLIVFAPDPSIFRGFAEADLELAVGGDELIFDISDDHAVCVHPCDVIRFCGEDCFGFPVADVAAVIL